jgi:alkanesulfonate monooxygenase SsuD/methylene tetrahydromethanopterin reductase-like flavin-dependent oxidoreductase (luciferase family)
VRIGLTLPAGRDVEAARLAEAAGLFGVLVEGERPGLEMLAAGEVAATTRSVRIVVRVPLGSEHPITLAEELAVLDNLAGGRLVVLADSAGLDADEAAEDLEVLRRSWTARPLRHRGVRWAVPAGIAGHTAPAAVMVTPPPAQVEVPVWLTGTAAATLAARSGLPAVAERPADARPDLPVQPAATALTGDLHDDRATVITWADAGATHLLVRAGPEAVATIARHLAPEVAMPGFPRVVAESPLPLPWPGTA